MTEIYGHAWTEKYGEIRNGSLPAAAATWGKGLSCLSNAQIARGLHACIKSGSEWPPSLPRFRRMCFGIPGLERVAFEINKDQRSPFTTMVLGYMDLYRYRTLAAKDADRLLKGAYELAVEAVSNGEPLPEQLPLIGAPEQREFVPASPETVAKAIREIQESLKGGA